MILPILNKLDDSVFSILSKSIASIPFFSFPNLLKTTLSKLNESPGYILVLATQPN